MSSAAKYAGRVALGAAAMGFGLCAYAYLTLPDVRPLRTTNPSITAFMKLRDEEALSKGLKPRRVQRWVAYARVSADLKRAVLVAEDDAFFQHEGVDFEQLQESLEVDWAKGRFARGASTITQQLAKNLYLSPSKNPLRKLRELVIARRWRPAPERASRDLPNDRVGRRRLRRQAAARICRPAHAQRQMALLMARSSPRGCSIPRALPAAPPAQLILA